MQVVASVAEPLLSEVYLLVNLSFKVICYLYSSVEKPVLNVERHFSCSYIYPAIDNSYLCGHCAP